MIITKAQKKDIHELNRLINSAYRGKESKKGWTTEADLLEGIRTDASVLEGMIQKENVIFLKCSDDENVIQGCIYLEKRNKKMYVGMLTVSPMLQARGIGKKLLYAAEEYAHKTACLAMQMTVISVREELIKWYERHGYIKTGETKPFPNDEKFGIPTQPLEFVVMEKNINVG